MEFTLRKSYDWNFIETITLNTLEDLKELQNKYSIAIDNVFYDTPKIMVDFNKANITIYY